MDLAFSEEQSFLREAAREFLERECPLSAVRELMDDPRGYREGIWKQMAELGWLGLLLGEEHGGADLGFVEAAVLVEQLGRALVPSPFFGNLLGTLAVVHAEDVELQKELLGPVASGEKILTLAVGEGGVGEDAIEACATREANAYRLSGTKRFVPDAQNADVLIVAARTGPGISLLSVDANAPGVELTPLASIDPTRRLADVRFADAPARLLGRENAGASVWESVRTHALVALSAEALGGMDKVLQDTVAYVSERKQFGRPIGANQAVQHACADLLIDLEAARSLTWRAAWAVAEGAPEAALAASMAKSFTSEAYRRVSASSIQLHGGVGFTWEYDCHLYYRRAKAIEVTCGDPVWHRERVAQLLQL